MRTIKFRGFDAIGERGWVYGDLIHNQRVTTTGLQPRVMVGGYEVIPKTVGQFTGLTDKNGREIYEGDIYINIRGSVQPDRAYSIRYRNGSWIGVAADNGWITLINDADEPYRDDLYYIEVIGNIHDNPELLE